MNKKIIGISILAAAGLVAYFAFSGKFQKLPKADVKTDNGGTPSEKKKKTTIQKINEQMKNSNAPASSIIKGQTGAGFYDKNNPMNQPLPKLDDKI